jgi:peptidoglycan/xylan/chitin deacetylase (PgdA/CDA1 family)
VAGWLGSYGGEDSASDVSRGLFAGEVGAPRLLKLFEKFGMKTTWFIPGHSLDTFPEQMAAVRDAGHEIGLHGYSHENPTSLTVEQQKVILDHTYDQITKFCGKPPLGSVAPWWEVSKEGGELLLDKGIMYGEYERELRRSEQRRLRGWGKPCSRRAPLPSPPPQLAPTRSSLRSHLALASLGLAHPDHSFMHRDSQAYYLRIGDDWKKIDYDKHPNTWMEPVQRGETTGMVEIPVNWDLDDLPPMMFMKSASNTHGFVDVRSIETKWMDHFTYLYENERDTGFCLPLTVHPDVSGRPHVLKMLERFIAWVNGHEGVEWVTYAEIAEDFRKRNPAPKGARMPKGFAA